MAAAIEKEGEEFASRILNSAFTSIHRQVAEIRNEKKLDLDPTSAESLHAVIEALGNQDYTPMILNLKHSAEAGEIGALYSIYRMLSEDCAHPTVSSLSRHTETLREENGNWKIILSEEPEFSDSQRCETLETAALALFGVAVSVYRARDICGLASEIDEIEESFARTRSK